jgi:hypothetical protein
MDRLDGRYPGVRPGILHRVDLSGEIDVHRFLESVVLATRSAQDPIVGEDAARAIFRRLHTLAGELEQEGFRLAGMERCGEGREG